MPAGLHFVVSRSLSRLYEIKLSRIIIPMFCWANGLSDDYQGQFTPASEDNSYQSFQDFFTRKLKVLPTKLADPIWPCEGYICELNQVANLPVVTVKGQSRNLKTIFHPFENQIPENYFFTNIFLHNHNYHHIHAPISGQIERIVRIGGELSILRPWAYQRHEVSKPALINERVNVQIKDAANRSWFLSIVGGMGVGTVILPSGIQEGVYVQQGQEIASFKLGSTCCMASPEKPGDKNYLEKIFVGDQFV